MHLKYKSMIFILLKCEKFFTITILFLKIIKKNKYPRRLITNLSQQQIYKATFIHFREDISNPNST